MPEKAETAKDGLSYNSASQQAVVFDYEKSFIQRVTYTDTFGNETVAEYTEDSASGEVTLSKVTYTASGGTAQNIAAADMPKYTSAWSIDYDEGIVKTTNAGTYNVTAGLRTPVWDGRTYLDGYNQIQSYETLPTGIDTSDWKPWTGTPEDGQVPNFWEIPVDDDKVEWQTKVTKEVDITVEAASISESGVSGIDASYIYTGSAIEPKPTVKVTLNGTETTLTLNTDYRVTYSTEHTNAGNTVTVTITGVGNFKGTVTKSFTINKATPIITNVHRTADGTLYEGAIPPAIECTSQFTPTGATEAVDVAGTIKIDAEKLEKGQSQKYSWTFTPEDTTNFEVVTGEITLTVEEAAVESLNITFDYAQYFADLASGATKKIYTSTDIATKLYDMISKYITVTGIMTDGSALPEGYGYTLSRSNNSWPAKLSGLDVWNGSVGAGWADLADGSASINLTCGNKVVTSAFSVPVTYVKLDRIAVTESPAKTDYVALTQLVTDGMVVTAYYNDGSQKAVTGYTIKYNNEHDSLWYGDSTATVVYKETTGGGEERERTATVGVLVSRIEFDTKDLSLSDANKPYNGSAQTITLSGTLPEGVFNVSYRYELDGNNIAASNVVNVVENGYTVIVTITNIRTAGHIGNNYSIKGENEFTATLTITKIDYEGVENIALDDDTAQYSAESKASAIAVKNLPAGVTVAYKYYKKSDPNTEITADEVKERGTYIVKAVFTVDGNHNAISDKTAELEIIAHTLTADEVTGIETTYTYKGEAWKPEPKVTVALAGVDTDLTKGDDEDYTVTYSTENYSAGTRVTVTVKGVGNYDGTVTKTFTITKAELELTWVYTGSGIYDGNVHSAKLTVTGTVFDADQDVITDEKLAGLIKINYLLISGGNTARTAAGTYQPTYSNYPESTLPWSNYEPTVKLNDEGEEFTFTVAEATLPAIHFEDKEVTYDGNTHFIYITVDEGTNISVTEDGKLSTKEIDVKYYADETGNIFIGRSQAVKVRVRVEITCTTGNYEIPADQATMYAYLTVKPKEIEDADVSGILSKYTYNGKNIEPVPTVKVELIEDAGANELVPTQDYTVEYSENRLHAGETVTVTVKGVGNYGGEVTKTFTIDKARLSFEWIGEDLTYTYNGAPQGVKGTFTGVADVDKATIVPVVYYEGNTGTTYAKSTTMPTNAGRYIVQIVLEAAHNDYYDFASTTTYFTIEKATPKVTVKYVSYDEKNDTLYVGQLLPEIAVNSASLNSTVTTVSGEVEWALVDGEVPVLKLNDNAYTWVFTPTGDDANNFKSVTGTLTIDAEEPTFKTMSVRWDTEDGKQPFLWSSNTLDDLREYLWVEATLTTGEEFGRVTVYSLSGNWGSANSPKASGYDETRNWNITIALGTLRQTISNVMYNLVTLESIEVVGADGGEITKVYDALSKFDTDSITVIAHYADGSEIVGVEGYTVEYLQSDDRLWWGNTSVKILYNDGTIDKAEEFTINGLQVNKITFDTSLIDFDSPSVSINYDGTSHSLTVNNAETFTIGTIEYVYKVKNGSNWDILDGVTSVTNAGEYRIEATLTIVDDDLIGEGVYTSNYILSNTLKSVNLTINKIKYEGADDIKFNNVTTDYNGDTANLYAAAIEAAATGVSDEVWAIVSYEYRLTVNGDILSATEAVHAGTYVVTVVFTPDANHLNINANNSVTIRVTVNKINPTVNPLFAEGVHPLKGMSIEEIILINGTDGTEGYFTWVSYATFDPATYVLRSGANVVYYTFTPNNTRDYNVLENQRFTITAKDNYAMYMYVTIYQGDTELFTSYTLEKLLELAADEDEKLKISVCIVFNDRTETEVTGYEVELLDGGEYLTEGKCYLKFTYILDGEIFTYDKACVNVHTVGLGSITAEFDQKEVNIFTSNNIADLLTLIANGDVDLTVTSYFNNGDFRGELAIGAYTLSGDWSDLTEDGEYSVKVSVTDGIETVSTTFKIQVILVILDHIEVTEFDQNGKHIYVSNGISALENMIESGNVTLTVTAIYNDDSQAEISFGGKGYTVSVETDFVTGTNTITVTYVEGGITKTETFDIEVTDVLVVSLYAKVNAVDTKIYTDTSLEDVAKLLTVTAYYNDGTEGEVTDFELIMPDGSDVLTAGTQVSVNVYYTENDIDEEQFEPFELIIGVVKHETTITFSGETVYTFDESSHAITEGATTNRTIDGNDDELTYEIDGGVAIIRNVKEYTLLITSKETKDYYGATLEVKITVEKADYDMSGITFEDRTVVYDGNAHTLTINGLLNVKVNVSGYEYVKDGEICDDSFATDAGVYKVTVTFTALDTDNYNEIAPMEATLTIEKAEVEIDESGLFATTYTYNGEEQIITGAKIVKADDLDAEISYENNTFTNVPAVGYLMVKITLEEGANYKAFEKEVKVNVNKAKLTLTANDNSITYGEAPANDGFTADGFVNEEEITYLTGTLAYGYDYSQYGNVGSYVITIGGVSSDNYEITFVAGKLTVNKAEKEVDWTVETYVYDGKAHAPTATFTDLFGAVITLTVNITASNGNYVSEAINAGKYLATAETSNPNYTLTGIEQAFTIEVNTDDWIKFDFRKDYTASYGSVPETAEELAALAAYLINQSYVRVSSSTNLDLDTIINVMTVRLEGNGNTPVTSKTSVGKYNVYFEFKEEYAETYSTYTVYQTAENPENTNLGRFVIEQRKLTLSWSESNFKYDGKSHLLTATVTGFVDGNTPVTFVMTEKGGEFSFDIDGTTVKFTLALNGDFISVGGHTVTVSIDNANYVITNPYGTASVKEATGLSTLTLSLIGVAALCLIIAVIAIIIAAKRKSNGDNGNNGDYDTDGFNEPYYEG